MNFAEPIKILLVDISSGHLRALEPKLQSAGLRTFIAQDYQQILSEARLGKFDLILVGESLTDVENIDLPQLLRFINAAGHLPIIWMPVKADSQHIIAGLELNIDLVLDSQTPLPVLLSYLITHARRKRSTDKMIESVNNMRSLLAQQNQHIYALKNNNSQLREMSMTDPLTGLFNARYMHRWLMQAFAFAIRYNKPLSVVFLDMDHFKWINDCYGHPAGDNALKVLARVLKNSVRDSDLVARYAGDEFLLALPETPSDQVGALAGRILNELKNTPLQSGGESFTLSCSMGSATYPEITPAATHQELLNLADQALYAAKRAGRGQLAQWHTLPQQHHEALTAAQHLLPTHPEN
jgi:two-component system, cell cycle response regulator